MVVTMPNSKRHNIGRPEGPSSYSMVEQPAKNDVAAAKPPKRENILLNIGLNVILPSILLMKGKPWLEKLVSRFPAIDNVLIRAADGVRWLHGYLESYGVSAEYLVADDKLKSSAAVLVVALAFPISYGLYDFAVRRKANFFSILGFVSVLISGGIGLMELDKDWVAIKEAAIPFLFAIAVLVSLATPFPLIRTFILNPELFDVPKIEAALVEKDKKQPFEKLMSRCTLMLAGSFLMSAVLNYFLARYFIRSETGTDAFNEELGKMNFWSWPVIVAPSMVITFFILNQLLNGIHSFTGYDVEDVMLVGQRPKRKKAGKGDAEKEKESPEVPSKDKLSKAPGAEASEESNVKASKESKQEPNSDSITSNE